MSATAADSTSIARAPTGAISARPAAHRGQDNHAHRDPPRTGSSTPRDDTITGHDSLGPLSTVPQRWDVPAFQAACRGFEPRLPLHLTALVRARRVRPLSPRRTDVPSTR